MKELKIDYYTKVPDLNWIGYFFAILLTFNIQVIALDIKKELFHPTFRRLRKVARISMGVEILCGIMLSSVGYLSLGDDFTPSLLFLRKAIPNHNIMEFVMKVLNFGFFIASVLGIPIMNVPLRRFLLQNSGLESVSKRVYVFVSLAPLVFILIISIVFPYII